MDLQKLKVLIELVSESGITELEITEGEEKIKIVNKPNIVPTTVMLGHHSAVDTAHTNVAPPSINQAPSHNTAPPVMPVAPASPPVSNNTKVIKSPMVGTFYTAASPDKPAFVNIGSEVKASQTVCIIEAMKLLNEIESGVDGKIIEMLVKNGTPVEFGQPLFTVA